MSETKRPLYVELKDKITPGEWVMNDYSTGKIFDPHFEVSSPNKARKIFDTPVVEEEDKANAQYTALAVNNLHILAEALKNALERMERARGILKRSTDANWGMLDTSDLQPALDNIS